MRRSEAENDGYDDYGGYDYGRHRPCRRRNRRLSIDEVNELEGSAEHKHKCTGKVVSRPEAVERKEDRDSSSYVSIDEAPDIMTLEHLVLQWTTLKPEEIQV